MLRWPIPARGAIMPNGDPHHDRPGESEPPGRSLFLCRSGPDGPGSGCLAAVHQPADGLAWPRWPLLVTLMAPGVSFLGLCLPEAST